MSHSLQATGSRRPEFRSLEERLWWARETAPLTQAQLAAQLGISKRTVQNYEAAVGHPSENRLKLWANACDVDYGWLAGDFYSQRPTSEVSSPSNRECLNPTRPYGFENNGAVDPRRVAQDEAADLLQVA